MREKITVLIADDNQEFSMTLATYLKNQEDMVVVGRAKDGNEALDMIPNLMPDVVLLDVIMPHLDGIGVLEKVTAANMKKHPICIMLSAVGQEKITQRALELGAEYYAIKPFDINVLLQRIKEIKNIRSKEYIYITPPEYIVQQMNGALPEETPATEDDIQKIKSMQEKMKC